MKPYRQLVPICGFCYKKNNSIVPEAQRETKLVQIEKISHIPDITGKADHTYTKSDKLLSCIIKPSHISC